MRLESFSKKQLLDYKVRRFEEFAFLPMEGPVNLENPNIVYQITEFYGINPNEAPEEPLEVFFGRLIGYGQHKTAEKYNLKQRVYIGNTSMDPVLALIMGNMGMARSSSLVYDPFVGTGSLLIAAAHFGAFTLGADISYPVLHARSKQNRLTPLSSRKIIATNHFLKFPSVQHVVTLLLLMLNLYLKL